MKKYFVFWTVLLAHSIEANSNLCEPPRGCKINNFNIIDTLDSEEYFSLHHEKGLKCVFKNSQYPRFNFTKWHHQNKTEICHRERLKAYLELKFTRKHLIFDTNLNIKDFIEFLLLYHAELTIRLANLRKISTEIMFESSAKKIPEKIRLELVNTKLDFYSNENKMIQTCEDTIETKVVRSIFQLNARYGIEVIFFKSNFHRPFCPLFFQNSRISKLSINRMANSFMKKNVISFSTNNNNNNNISLENLNSNIFYVYIYLSDNIDLDEKLLNQFVFSSMRSFVTYSSVGKIDTDIFSYFKRLNLIQFESFYLRKIMHRNGIEWIRSLNRDVKVR